MAKTQTAVLDENNVLVRYSKEKKDKKFGVEVPDPCDLVLGRYRWNPDYHSKGIGSFEPYTAPAEERINMSSDALYCIASAIKAIHDGVPMPEHTLEWLDKYFQDFDEKGKRGIDVTE